MTNTINLTVAFVLVFLEIGCNRLVVKPLSQSFVSIPDCAVPKDKNALVSFEEDSLLRQNSASTAPLRIISNYGSNNKFVKLFGPHGGDAKQYTLIFHFIDRYDNDFIQGKILFKSDSIAFEEPIHVDPASVIISEASDQFYFVHLTDSEINTLAFSKSVFGRIGPIDFELPFLCRDEWRNFLKK
jgi:hypothetical protein